MRPRPIEYVLRRPDLIPVVHPRIPISRLSKVALDLDRRANLELNAGRALVAEKLSRRAEELREITTLSGSDLTIFQRIEQSSFWVRDFAVVGGRG